MKRLILAAILILCLVSVSFAVDFGAPTGKSVNVVFPAETYITLLSGSGTTGISLIKDIGFTPKETKCFVTNGGTAPTNFVVAFYTGPDTTNMYLAYPSGTTSTTITRFPTGVSFVNGYGDRYWKVNYVSVASGDVSTTITVKCTGLK